jgi:DnaJ-domain-containing protein 1
LLYLLSFAVLAALLYLMGWVPAGDTGRVARFVRKHGLTLFAAGATLILAKIPALAMLVLLSGMLAYPVLQKKEWIPGRPPSGKMSVEEAYDVLGLRPGAAAEEIKSAHRNLMKRSHPDQGGTAYLAAKVNEAKEVLLKNVKG